MRKFIFPAVIALIGAWVLYVGSNLRVAYARSLQKRTMVDMRSIATMLEARATNVNSYDLGPRPRTMVASSVEAFDRMQRIAYVDLQRELVPKYAKRLPIADGWGRPFDVRIGGYDAKGHATAYAIRSLGSDGRADGGSYVLGTISRYSQDLLFSDGNFIRYPDGIL